MDYPAVAGAQCGGLRAGDADSYGVPVASLVMGRTTTSWPTALARRPSRPPTLRFLISLMDVLSDRQASSALPHPPGRRFGETGRTNKNLLWTARRFLSQPRRLRQDRVHGHTPTLESPCPRTQPVTHIDKTTGLLS